jgi:hypothetical protein
MTTNEMSDDHVPPQGAIDISEVEANCLFEMYEGSKAPRPKFLQNGLVFRTICRECNTLLGEYDRHLIKFVKTMRSIARSGLLLPEATRFYFQPNAIIRATAGHLVAAKIHADDSPFDRKAREFILNKDAPVPPEWDVYYWAYPYTRTVIVRDTIIAKLDFSWSLGFCQVLKFFPVGFLFRQNPFPFGTMPDMPGINCLSRFKEQPASFEAAVPGIPFRAPNPNWPEDPPRAGFTVGPGLTATVADRRKRRRR